MVYKVDDAFEELNSGVADEEPEDAGPGVMGHILISMSHVKEKVTSARSPHSPHSPGSGSTLTTPSGLETSQHESKVEDLKDSSHNVESKVGEDPQVHSPPDVQHDHSVGLDSPGVGGSPTGSSSYVESGASSAGSGRSLWEGSTDSPRSPLGERIMTMLPGGHTNPYSVSGTTHPHPASPHPVGHHSAIPTSPSIQGRAPSSPRGLSKLELVTHFADRLHLHKKSSSPRAAIESPGTPTTNTSTDVPSSTTGGPRTTADTATSPTVD